MTVNAYRGWTLTASLDEPCTDRAVDWPDAACCGPTATPDESGSASRACSWKEAPPPQATTVARAQQRTSRLRMTVVLLVRCGSIPLPCHGHSGRRRMETARNCVGIPRTCDRLNCAPRWSFPPLCRRPSRRFMVCLGRMECPFCAICRGELSASVVLRDEHACAFLDTRPVFKGHVLVVPREHVADLLDLARTEMEPLLSAVQLIAAAMEKGLSADGSFVAGNTKI